MPIVIGAVVFGACIASPAVGESLQQPLQEVFQTELVYPQQKGEIQLTLSPEFRKSDVRKLWEFPLGVEYGLTDAWQASAEWTSYQSLRPASEDAVSGIGDLEIGTKYSFMEIGGSNTHAALGFSVTFPLGDVDRDLSEGYREYEPSLMAAHDFPQWGGLQIFTQAGAGFRSRAKSHEDPEEDEPETHEFFWNNGVFLPWKDWRWTAELNWTTNRWNHDGDEAEVYATPGVVYKLSPDWEVGAASALGLNDRADEYRVLGKVVYEFQLFGKDTE